MKLTGPQSGIDAASLERGAGTLKAPAAGPDARARASARKVAQEFEALFAGFMIKAMREGILDLTNGKGDYSIGHNPCLWFWWEVTKG